MQAVETASDHPDFRALFESVPGNFIVLTPDFTIIAVSNSFLETSRTRREEILGRMVFSVFPGMPGHPNAETVQRVQDSLRRVLSSRKPDTMPVLRYDLLNAKRNELEERYWSFSCVPVLNEAGEVVYLIQKIMDATEVAKLREANLRQEQAQLVQERMARAAAEAYSTRITTILESITDAFFSVDKEWRFTYVNKEAYRILRHAEGSLVGRNIWEEFPEAVNSIFWTEYYRAAKEQIPVVVEAFYPPLEAWFLVHVYPSEGGLAIYFQDITQQKQDELALRKSEHNFAALVEGTPNLISTTLPNGNVDYVNQRWRNYTGMNSEESLDQGWQNAVHPEDLPGALRLWKQCLETGEPLEIKYRLRNKAGEYRWFLMRAVALRDAEGQITRWFSVASDIDDQERIQRERERFLAVGSDLLAITDLEMNLKWLSPNWESALGWTEQEVKERGWLYFLHPGDREKSIGIAQKLKEGHETITFENRQLHKDGSYRWIEWKTMPAVNEKLLYWRASDITERKLAEAALRESRERLWAALSASGMGTFRWNIRTNVVDWDENLDRLFGLPPGQTAHTQDNFISFVHPEDRQEVIDRCDACARYGADFDMEFRVIWLDGTIHWLSDKGKTFLDADSRPLYMTGACVDVTERRRNEESLRSSQLRLSTIYDTAPVGICECDMQGRFFSVNQRFTEITGFSKEELLVRDFDDITHPDDASFNSEMFRRLVAGEVPNYMLEKRYVHKDGHSLWVNLYVALMRDHDGNPLQTVGAVQDITQRRKTEAELQEAQVKLSHYAADLEKQVAERTVKLKETINSLEGLTYTIAHDLRAPLRAMEGFSAALKEDYAATIDEAGRDYLNRIAASAERMDSLIQELLEYGRLSRVDIPLSKIRVQEVVENVLANSSHDMQARRAEVLVDRPMLSVTGNAAILEHAVRNLVGNALKFAKPGTAPEIHIRTAEQNGKVRIFVMDNGIGIDPKYHDRIFRVFERIDVKQNSGTGIGLAIVQKSAERMGGTAGVESRLGDGSTFWIELPKSVG